MTIREVTIHGNPRWLVEFGYPTGKRKRLIYKTEAEAKAAVRSFEQERKRAGRQWSQLAPETRVKVGLILQEMADHGTNLGEVWTFWKANKQRRAGRLLGEVVEEFLIARKASGISTKYAFQLENYLGQFARDRGKLDVADITPRLLDDWFASRKEAPATRQTGINRLSALFSFCERREYIKENPCKRVERVRVPHKDPEILTVEECKRLVETAAATDEGMLTYLGLALFCGIRPDEALRIERKEIDLARGLVFLAAEKSKVRNRRIVKLTEPAKRCIQAGGPVPKTNFKRRFNRLRKEAAMTRWPHDVLRKTAASHFYNLYGIEKATEQLGHSAGVLLRVYRELVSHDQTRLWLQIAC